jgi:hypothetical protein
LCFFKITPNQQQGSFSLSLSLSFFFSFLYDNVLSHFIIHLLLITEQHLNHGFTPLNHHRICFLIITSIILHLLPLIIGTFFTCFRFWVLSFQFSASFFKKRFVFVAPIWFWLNHFLSKILFFFLIEFLCSKFWFARPRFCGTWNFNLLLYLIALLWR